VGGTIVDPAAAVRLGKALFWDVQVGSDGRTACATCHFHAGADARRTNTVSPGPDALFSAYGTTSAGQTVTLTPGVVITSDDRIGSAGVARATFLAVSADPADPSDSCSVQLDASFGAHRQVTDRQAPTVIGAVFYREGFWDGRASHRFNGLDASGLARATPLVENASLASQAVGPALSPIEMSCDGRPFNGPGGLGAKLLPRQPLSQQRVHSSDGVLGPLADPAGTGLLCNGVACTYADLVAAAFGSAAAARAPDEFSSLFGQAIAAYEATLVPDHTPYDRFVQGDPSALTAPQQAGLAAFRAKCAACHAEPEFSDATVRFTAANGLVNGDGGDQGFHNLGLRPTAEDLGRGGSASGRPLSASGDVHDRGAFKTPTLRNVGLTAPYFHTGGWSTLEDVLTFYGSAFAQLPNPEKSPLLPIALLAAEKADIVDFLRSGLTDCRVEHGLAPFDHPSLAVPDGPDLLALGSAGDGTFCP
jgi:cytochrome c peroxidase